MTQGWPAGRIGGKSSWCRSTLFSYKTLIFPAITVFWCFGVFKEADTLEKIILFISILLLYNFWRKLRRLQGSTAQTTSIATSMKLTGYHKPLCLHYTNQFIPITSELQRSIYWSEGPDHQGGGQLSRTLRMMRA